MKILNLINSWNKLISFVALTMVTTNSLAGYSLSESSYPVSLEVTLKLRKKANHSIFTRYLTFKNAAGNEKDIAINFSGCTGLSCTGVMDNDDLDKLRGFAEYNKRSYWDKMYFTNKGGSTYLSIRKLTVKVLYSDLTTSSEHETEAIIGQKKYTILKSGHDSFRISGNIARRKYAMDYLSISKSEFLKLPRALKRFIYDIGKSGSSGSEYSNPDKAEKYHNDANTPGNGALCSETVSYYYKVYGVGSGNISTDDFENVISHEQLHDTFKEKNRLYCYHTGLKGWYKKDANYNWDYSRSYRPQAGDYLDRRDSNPDVAGDNGHAMMVVDWNHSTKEATVMDGPYRINFRKLNIQHVEENKGKDYCVGRIPLND